MTENTPMRPGRSGPESTQEIDASDVLEVMPVSRVERRSYPSLMKVGIDLGVDIEAGRNDDTHQIRLAARRKELSRYVIGAVAVSCAILVASFVKREASASSGTLPSTQPTMHPAAAAPAPARTALPVAIPPPPPQAVATPAPTTDSTGSGSIRFTPPAKAGWIWLDGKRLSGTSAFVSCGTHQVKVGYSAKHVVTVPCGGELVLSR
jgi:hypothetical protein